MPQTASDCQSATVAFHFAVIATNPNLVATGLCFESLSRECSPVKSGEWHTLRVDFAGNKFTVTFDGKKVIEATDEIFAEAGKVGVWTKADSVTLFDDFSFGSN